MNPFNGIESCLNRNIYPQKAFFMNPFNGIERKRPKDWDRVEECVERIRSMELKAGMLHTVQPRRSVQPGIRSMELKVSLHLYQLSLE